MLQTVSSVPRTPRVVWPPPTMPQRNTRRASSDFDAIDPAFPPPSLKSQTGWDGEKRKKKDKKWSIGGLFRRKKKVSDTDSSSPVEDDEEKKGFLERRRAARKRRNRGSKDVTGSFEHVIINPPRNQRVDNTYSDQIVDNERLLGRNDDRRQQEFLQMRASSVSLEGTGRKGSRIKTKARVEANRDRLKSDSSSDEGGGSSRHSTSSVQKIKSDDTSGSKDGSLSRRSRAARTERYKKRISRDEDSLKDFQTPPHSRISRSDEILSNKKSERASSGSRWTAKVVYCESSDYDTKYTAKTKSATPSPIQSPKTKPKNALHYTASAPSGSNYVTFPPGHIKDGVARSHQELRSFPQSLSHTGIKSNQRFSDLTPPRLPKSNSDLVGNFPLSNSATKHYPSWGQDALCRKSASYDCNVNSMHHLNNHSTKTNPEEEGVLFVQFPISRPVHKIDNKTNQTTATSQQMLKQSNPPPPPPRDPHRRLVSTNGHQDTSPRPMSYAFEDTNQHQTKYQGLLEFGSSISAFQRVPQTTRIDFQPTSTINKHHRSSSDHKITTHVNSVKNSPPASRRPSSVHPESQTFSVNLESFTSSPSNVQSGIPNNYHYFTDQQPRSRKPIHISYQQHKTPNDSYLSDSQVVIKPPVFQTQRARPLGVQNASDFWKQKDQENVNKVHISEGSPKLIQRHFLNVSTTNERSRSHSPHIDSSLVTGRVKLPPLTMPVGTESSVSLISQSSPREIPSPRTPTGKKLVHNEIGIPVFDSAELNSKLKRDFRPLSMLEEKQETSEQVIPVKEKENNPPIPPTRRESKINAVTNFEHFDILEDDFESKEGQRKSSNLEEALNELEAIYKSLRLGEEGYIEKVAREKAIYENNRLDPTNWNAWVKSRGFESDSSFNYSRSSLESVDSLDSPIKRSNIRKSGMPDRVTDDMAYRRLNKKDRPPPHEQEVISQAGSFLLVSPTLSPPPFVETPPPVPTTKNEPDITLDDVVYRNINHINNSLKVLDPQPPFGIPLGPITPAPNSDYLHATPKEMFRPTFKPRKTPDIVTDDLAFRNLRKDNNKEPLFTPEDTTLIDSPTLKKKRAVRSLSANLLSIIQKESMVMNNKLVYNNNNIQNDLEKSQSFTDVANANVANEEASRYHLGGNKQQSDFVLKKNLSGDDSDPTPRGSRIFSTEISSPLITTSTETLTDSKSSLWFHDLKPCSHNLSQNISPRLSLTPERRHTTDNIQFETRKSLSPTKHVPVKLEPLKHKCSLKSSNNLLNDFQRSPTPDSHSFTHHKDINEEKSQSIYNQKESELLAALAKEAKEASEQLSRELNELNFDNTLNKQVPCGIISKQDEEEKENSDSTPSNALSMHPKSFSIGKITSHKPVKLNTFCITSDNKLENKQTILMNSSRDIEGSKSMTDLLKELTKSLDIDFETCSIDNETLSTHTTEEKTYIKDSTENIEAESILESNDSQTIEKNVISYDSHPPLSLVSDHKLSTPERLLLSSFPNTQPEEAIEQKEKICPVNQFPLSLPDTSEEEFNVITQETRTLHNKKIPVPSEILPEDESRPSEGCSRDCSNLANEGTKSVRTCADPNTLLFCMACAHQLTELDCFTVFGLILAIASLILFLIL